MHNPHSSAMMIAGDLKVDPVERSESVRIGGVYY